MFNAVIRLLIGLVVFSLIGCSDGDKEEKEKADAEPVLMDQLSVI